MAIDLLNELKAQRTRRHLPPNYIGDLCGRAAVEIEDLRAGGWIVGNGDGTKWRMWADGMPMWTPDRSRATQYHRREDAEAVHREDDDDCPVVSGLLVQLHPCEDCEEPGPAMDFNLYFDKATRLGQIIQGESGAVNPLAFQRAQDILSEFDVIQKEQSE